MKKKKEGKVEYFEVGNGDFSLLSIGKLHGDENRPKEGILRALKEIGKNKGSLKYIAVPEVNPLATHEYGGINLNKDFGIFKSKRTRSLDKIIRKYGKSSFIVDHHDDLDANCEFPFIIIPYEAWNEDDLEVKVGEKVIREIYLKEGLPEKPPDYIEGEKGENLAEYFDFGIYRFLRFSMETALVPYYKRIHSISGMVIEVPKCMEKEKAIEIHKICDLIVKAELERLFSQ